MTNTKTMRIANNSKELVSVLKDMESRGFELDHIENMVDHDTLTVSFKVVYK